MLTRTLPPGVQDMGIDDPAFMAAVSRVSQLEQQLAANPGARAAHAQGLCASLTQRPLPSHRQPHAPSMPLTPASHSVPGGARQRALCALHEKGAAGRADRRHRGPAQGVCVRACLFVACLVCLCVCACVCCVRA
jgi:hypothetical protein